MTRWLLSIRRLLQYRRLLTSSSFSSPQSHHLLRPISPLPFLPSLLRFFSSSTPPTPISPLAHSISTHLINHSVSSSNLDIADHFTLHFSDVCFNSSLVAEILRLSSPAGRSAFDLYCYLVKHRSLSPTDESLSHLIAFFGRRHDFKAISDVLAEFRHSTGPKSYIEAVDRLVRAGRAPEAVKFFADMEKEYGIKRDKEKLGILVKLLCEHGYAFQAENLVNNWAKTIFPSQEMCYDLVKGWCVDQRPDHAIRLMGEMVRGGFEIQTPAYNAILDSVCKLCRKKDPLQMQKEADKVLVEMEKKGVARDTETFSVIIRNLCKIRKTEDAMKLFGRMGEWGCSPDGEMYVIMVRSLYQAARVKEADDMIKQMWGAGFGDALNVKECFGFLKILCGIQRVDHAMKVFRYMKKCYGFEPGVKTYELLIRSLSSHNQVDRANALFQEAAVRGITVIPKAYVVDPRYLKKVAKSKEKKRLSLPQKKLMKRKRLRKLKASFVKKPRKRRLH